MGSVQHTEKFIKPTVCEGEWVDFQGKQLLF